MTENPLATKVSMWKETTLLERLGDCRRMLLFHGLLTNTESVKVRHRIEKILGRYQKDEHSHKEHL